MTYNYKRELKTHSEDRWKVSLRGLKLMCRQRTPAPKNPPATSLAQILRVLMRVSR